MDDPLLDALLLEAPPELRLVVQRLVADRDALQARLDAYEGKVEAWEEMDRLIAESSLGTAEARAIIERTPPGVGMAIVRASQYLGDVEERDETIHAMRPVVAAAVAYIDAYNAIDRTAQDLDTIRAQMHAELDALTALHAAVSDWREAPGG